MLFVNLDPRAVLDVESSLRTTWPLASRLGADPSRICLELVAPGALPPTATCSRSSSPPTASAAR